MITRMPRPRLSLNLIVRSNETISTRKYSFVHASIQLSKGRTQSHSFGSADSKSRCENVTFAMRCKTTVRPPLGHFGTFNVQNAGCCRARHTRITRSKPPNDAHQRTRGGTVHPHTSGSATSHSKDNLTLRCPSGNR